MFKYLFLVIFLFHFCDAAQTSRAIVYHKIFPPFVGGGVETVCQHGLCSYDELVNKELVSEPRILKSNNIFFWVFEYFKNDPTCIGYSVNPETTMVFNANYRNQSNNMEAYEKSKMTLAAFLLQLNKAKNLKTKDLNDVVILTPITAEPILCSTLGYYRSKEEEYYAQLRENYVKYSSHLSLVEVCEPYEYLPEVPIEVPNIPSNQLIFFNKK